jgi:hypothetical protein
VLPVAFALGIVRGTLLFVGTMLMEIVCDLVKNLVLCCNKSHAQGLSLRVLILSIIESTVIKNYADVWRVLGHWSRRRVFDNFCKRFDWFCGYYPDIVANEQREATLRFAAYIAAVLLVYVI